QLGVHFVLAGGPLDPRQLASALQRPAWDVDLGVAELLSAGVLARVDSGRVEATCLIDEAMKLSPAERRGSHQPLPNSMRIDDEVRLAHLLASDRAEMVPDAASSVAAALIREGRPNEALVVASEGLAVLRRLHAEPADREDSLLCLLMDSAISVGTTDAIDV